jgi:cell division septum initiation protein DivIVA
MPANSDILQAALIGYQAEITRIEQAMAEIRAELKGSAGASPSATPTRAKRKISAAARNRMAAAQKKRWAAFRKQKLAKA